MTKKQKHELYQPVDQVDVFLWGYLVGVVALDPSLGFYVFAYNKNFAKKGIAVSPLHMPLNDQEKIFAFTDLPEATYKRLPAMLADALPDDFGNALINRYMADRGLSPNLITPLDRLAYMSDRAMGALEFKPARGPASHKATALEMSSLVSEARNVVRGTLNDEDETNAALRNIIDVGTSNTTCKPCAP